MNQPWRGTTTEISSQIDSRYETPGGAQAKVDEAIEDLVVTEAKYADGSVSSRVIAKGAIQSQHFNPSLLLPFSTIAMQQGFDHRGVDVTDARFGALGDGVSDDTAAIQLALNTGNDVIFPDGTYKITGTISVANNGYQKIIGIGNVTLSVNLPSSIDLFVFSGPVSIENILVDFNNSYCKYAFKYGSNVGNIRITNVRMRSLKDTDSTTGSIMIFIPPTGNTFQIEALKAYSMIKRGNGNITDAAGSLNLIYIGGDTGSTQGSIKDITVDTIHNINSSDVVIYEDTSVIYVATDSGDSNNRIVIDGVTGINFGKRLLKIHASNVSANNVTGYSTEGDTLSVISFLNGDGLGDKNGCSASYVSAYGSMDVAFSASSYGVKWSNVIAYTTPGTKPGMIGASFGLLINGNDTFVDGFESGSQRIIGIGSNLQIIKNTKIKNIKINFTSSVTSGFQNISSTLGFDGLNIDNVYAVHDITSAGIQPAISTDLYLNGTTIKGRNIIVRNVHIISPGPVNSQGIIFKYCENVSLNNFRYINTSSNIHFRLAVFDTCNNVNVDDVVIEGLNQIGVHVSLCTGRNTINRVQNTSATVAAVYNNNSADVIVQNCDPAKVSGITTATPQNPKWTVGTTTNRPTTGLVTGISQHYDTTLNKPIWWNGSVWKDATGTTV